MKTGMNINGIIITTLEELEAAIADMDDLSKEVIRAAFKEEDLTEANAPLSMAAKVKADTKAGVEARMNHGWMVVKEFRAFSTSLSDEQGVLFLAAVSDLIMMLQLGMLQAAAATLSTVTDNEIMNMAADYYGEPSITLKDYFVAKILEGDPL